MPLLFHPKVGDVLICAFPDCLAAPEMVKTRPVVVMTKERPGRPLCIVVPLSTTEPVPVEAFHVGIADAGLPKSLQGKPHWAKCDMLYTLSISRLDRIKVGRDRATGRRIYETGRVSVTEIQRLKDGIKAALNITH
jgi:mRNA interferase MazF